MEQWVTICDKEGIRITAQQAQEPVRRYRKEPAASLLESERPKYSKDAFIDAIVDFVVGDDLVCIKF